MSLSERKVEEAARQAHVIYQTFLNNNNNMNVNNMRINDDEEDKNEEEEEDLIIKQNIQRIIPKHKRPRIGRNLKVLLFFQELKEQIEQMMPTTTTQNDNINQNINQNNHQLSTVGKVCESIRKCEIRIRDVKTANGLHGVGAKMLKHFEVFFRLYPQQREDKKEKEKERLLNLVKERERMKKKKKSAQMLEPKKRQRENEEEEDEDGMAFPPSSQNQQQQKENVNNNNKDGRPQKTKKINNKKWEPGYKTAAFAMLATLHKFLLEGKDTCSKEELISATDNSGLSKKTIRPPPVGPSHGAGGFQGAAATALYSGWSSFNQLKAAPRGHEAPLVQVWSNPMKIRLTPEGIIEAERCHRDAEIRGDCKCGLLKNGNASNINMEKQPRRAQSREDLEHLPRERVSEKQQKKQHIQVVSLSTDSENDDEDMPEEWNSTASLGIRLPPLPPGKKFQDIYEIVIIMDSREKYYQTDKKISAQEVREGVEKALLKCGIRSEHKNIEIGDVIWVAENKMNKKERYVLDYIIERKAVEDLSSSIKDGRYTSQKYHLEHAGLWRVMYLVEGDIKTGKLTEPDKKQIFSACIETDILNEMYILRTENVSPGTIDLYVNLTNSIKSLYNPMRMDGNSMQRQQSALPTFHEFTENMRDFTSKERTVENMWGIMLTQVSLIGLAKAEAIINQYPTPIAMYEEFDSLNWNKSNCENVIAQIECKGKKIGPAAARKVFEFFSGE